MISSFYAILIAWWIDRRCRSTGSACAARWSRIAAGELSIISARSVASLEDGRVVEDDARAEHAQLWGGTKTLCEALWGLRNQREYDKWTLADSLVLCTNQTTKNSFSVSDSVLWTNLHRGRELIKLVQERPQFVLSDRPQVFHSAAG